MLDAIQQTASAADEDTCAGDERSFRGAFEQLKFPARACMIVQRLRLLPAREAGIALSRIVSPGRQSPEQRPPSSVFNSARVIGTQSIEMFLM
jgi:hypothetical protein